MAEKFDWSQHTELLQDVIQHQQLGPFDPSPLKPAGEWMSKDERFFLAYDALLSWQRAVVEDSILVREAKKQVERIRKENNLGRPTMNYITELASIDAKEIRDIEKILNPELYIPALESTILVDEKKNSLYKKALAFGRKAVGWLVEGFQIIGSTR